MKILLSLACCLLAALLAGCAPASSASASTSLPDSGSPASVSQPAGEAANASESTEWTDEAVAELFLSQEENECARCLTARRCRTAARSWWA